MKAIWIIVVMLLAITIYGCGQLSKEGYFDRSTSLNFFINETEEPLDGYVLLDGSLLGNTTNGLVVVDKLKGGNLVLRGTDPSSGADFEFGFTISPEDTAFKRLSFEVPIDNYRKAVFDASSLDEMAAEKEIFKLANDERTRRGIKPLRWNEAIANVARKYSASMPFEGFHHTDTTGKDVKGRLSDAGLIYVVANENLYFSGSLTEDNDLAKSAIEGWLGSPGHRATLLDRDGLYSDAGVGVHCERRDCYAVMDFASMFQEQKFSLNKGWVAFHYLYNPDYNFPEDNIPVEFGISSVIPVNAYLVRDRSDYDSFLSGQKPDSVMEFNNITSVTQKFVASQGEGLIIESVNGNADVDFTLDFTGG